LGLANSAIVITQSLRGNPRYISEKITSKVILKPKSNNSSSPHIKRDDNHIETPNAPLMMTTYDDDETIHWEGPISPPGRAGHGCQT